VRKLLPHSASKFAWVAVLCAGILSCFAAAQSTEPVSLVRSVRVVQEEGATAVEILSKGPLTPKLEMLKSPLRLVIDLPNSRLRLQSRRNPAPSENITAVRIAQKQDRATRIVLELAAPYSYTWDETHNRTMIRLNPIRLKPARSKPVEQASAKKDLQPRPPQSAGRPSIEVLSASAPVVIPVTSGVGNVVLAGNRFAAGSSISAASDTAVLQLARGGEVHVCPGTTVSVTPSPNKRDLMLGLSTGALEAHYELSASADSVLTPDFRILFAGPGEFDFAISVDSHGNTCVRSLMGNASSVIVSELMGDRIYQVKPTEQAVFRAGQIDHVDADVPLECGCPPPSSTLRADATTPAPASEAVLPEKAVLGGSTVSSPGEGASSSNGTAGTRLSNGPETAPLPPTQPNDVHVEVDAPFVFSAKNRAANSRPSAVQAARSLPVKDAEQPPVHLDAIIEFTPPPKNPRLGHRLFSSVKGFFSYLFAK